MSKVCYVKEIKEQWVLFEADLWGSLYHICAAITEHLWSYRILSLSRQTIALLIFQLHLASHVALNKSLKSFLKMIKMSPAFQNRETIDVKTNRCVWEMIGAVSFLVDLLKSILVM